MSKEPESTISIKTQWRDVRALVIYYSFLTGDIASVEIEDARDQGDHYTDAFVDFMGKHIHPKVPGVETQKFINKWRDHLRGVIDQMLDDIEAIERRTL